MNNPEFQKILDLCARKDRAWRTFQRRTTKLAALADPRTGGNECLTLNWGADEARRIWSDGWKRWDCYSAEFQRRYDVMIRAYSRSGRIAA